MKKISNLTEKIKELESKKVFRAFTLHQKEVLFSGEIELSQKKQVILTAESTYTTSDTLTLVISTFHTSGIPIKSIEIGLKLEETGYFKTKIINPLQQYKALSQRLTRNGLTLQKGYYVYLHRLVCALDNDINDKEVHHNNAFRNDNRIANLSPINKALHQVVHKNNSLEHYYNNTITTTKPTSTPKPHILPEHSGVNFINIKEIKGITTGKIPEEIEALHCRLGLNSVVSGDLNKNLPSKQLCYLENLIDLFERMRQYSYSRERLATLAKQYCNLVKNYLHFYPTAIYKG